MAAKRLDWTTDKNTGRSNSSPQFMALVNEIERLIRSDAHALIAGNAGSTARLIMAQLAHKHHLRPAR
jgi:DNA-binding NtrC family response regulator